jgi:hypothetical protein
MKMNIADLINRIRQKTYGPKTVTFQSVEPEADYVHQSSGTLFYDYHEIPGSLAKEQLTNLLDYLPDLDLKHGPWLAGGAARRLLQGQKLEGGDIDLFFRKSHQFIAAKSHFSGYEVLFESKQAISYMVHGFKVQIINRQFYETLDDVFKDFDFSVCQIATDGKRLAYTTQAHQDIESGTLRFAPQGKVARHTLMGRMLKYINHGFVPEPGFYELAVKAGLERTNVYEMFEAEDSVAVYDHEEQVDNILSVKLLQDQVLKDMADRMGVEMPND